MPDPFETDWPPPIVPADPVVEPELGPLGGWEAPRLMAAYEKAVRIWWSGRDKDWPDHVIRHRRSELATLRAEVLRRLGES